MNNIEKFEKSSLRNLSNNMYRYLKTNNEKRINIRESFDFDDYKEAVRFELFQFSLNFKSLDRLTSVNAHDLIDKKSELEVYVNEIINDETMLERYSIYKIQQFINRVAKNILKNEYETFVEESKEDKCIEYKDIEIDASRVIGYKKISKIISHLYNEFGLKKLKIEDYSDYLLQRNSDSITHDEKDQINKVLFEAAVDIDENNHLVIGHPVKDDRTIFRYLSEGCVAKKIPKRVLKKVIEEDVEEISIE